MPLAHYRPDIPQWLENGLLKALAHDKNNRIETADELLVILERGEFNAVLPPRRSSLVERQSLLLWQSLTATLAIICLPLVYLLVVR